MSLAVSTKPSDIKRSKKESLLLREISRLFMQTVLDDPRLAGLFVNRVQLSPDRGMCTVFIYSSAGKEAFDEVFDTLKLYKPSLRKAVAHAMQSRYTPELKFVFDGQQDKQSKLNDLIEKLKDEGQL